MLLDVPLKKHFNIFVNEVTHDFTNSTIEISDWHFRNKFGQCISAHGPMMEGL
jgi:hypothetical protein